jgi:hypothetical protein
MATNANWTIVFEDKLIIKKTGSDQGSYEIDDNTFWSQSKFSNIWAIQYGNSNPSDEVEYRDGTPHSSYDDANLGDITQFTNKWDEAHLAQLQAYWDEDESDESEKGPRPTSYSS